MQVERVDKSEGYREEKKEEESLIKLPDDDEDLVWYFAFGSNLHPTVFGPEAARHRQRRVHPRRVKRGYIPGWRLVCNLRAVPVVEPGMGNIAPIVDGDDDSDRGSAGEAGARDEKEGVRLEREPQRQRCVHGVAYLITREEFDRIYLSEGGGKGGSYRMELLTMIEYDDNENDVTSDGDRDLVVVSSDGKGAAPCGSSSTTTTKAVKVRACYCPSDAPQTRRGLDLPSRRYANLLREGARHHRLDPHYCDYLDAYPCADPPPFVRWAVLASLIPVAGPAVPLVLTKAIISGVHRKFIASSSAAAAEDSGPVCKWLDGAVHAYLRVAFGMIWRVYDFAGAIGGAVNALPVMATLVALGVATAIGVGGCGSASKSPFVGDW